MNSTLKLLLLNCIILIVLAFSINTAIRKQSKDTNLSIHFPRTLSRETRLTGKVATTTDNSGESSMKNPVAVASLTNDGVYFDFNAPQVTVIDFDSLEKINDVYYKNASTTYYKEHVVNPCDNVDEEKMVALSDEDGGSFVVDGSQLFAHNSKDVFVDFYRVKNADPSTFTYVGQSKSMKNDYLNDVDTFWYKDANKIYVIIKVKTACKGESVLEAAANQNFKDVDISTFEYLGTGSGDPLTGYAKDKNFFYSSQGVLSKTVVPETCKGDFLKECLPLIQTSSPSLVQ